MVKIWIYFTRFTEREKWLDSVLPTYSIKDVIFGATAQYFIYIYTRIIAKLLILQLKLMMKKLFHDKFNLEVENSETFCDLTHSEL